MYSALLLFEQPCLQVYTDGDYPRKILPKNLTVAVDEAPTAFERLLIKVHQVEEAISKESQMRISTFREYSVV
jgi:hypothetical protein